MAWILAAPASSEWPMAYLAAGCMKSCDDKGGDGEGGNAILWKSVRFVGGAVAFVAKLWY